MLITVIGKQQYDVSVTYTHPMSHTSSGMIPNYTMSHCTAKQCFITTFSMDMWQENAHHYHL